LREETTMPHDLLADIANGRPVPAEALRDIDLWTG
jgi:hypothetical protein